MRDDVYNQAVSVGVALSPQHPTFPVCSYLTRLRLFLLPAIGRISVHYYIPKRSRQTEIKTCRHTTALTCDNFYHHGPLLLNGVFVWESGVAAVITDRVVKEDMREIQVPIHTHRDPAVLPHWLHGGKRCLNGPIKRSRIWACNQNTLFGCQIGRPIFWVSGWFLSVSCCWVTAASISKWQGERHYSWSSSRSQVLAAQVGCHRKGPTVGRRWSLRVPGSPAATSELLHTNMA